MRPVLLALASLPFVFCAGGCSRRPPLSDAEAVEVYAAVLADSGTAALPPTALNPQLLSDTGTYAGAGRLSPAVVAALVRRGLFAEVCRDGPVRYGIAECASRQARIEVRLSRPVPAGGDTTAVFVGAANVVPEGERPLEGMGSGTFATTRRCLAVRREAAWKLAGCTTTMMT
jgi:hypothetical protein